MIWICSKKKAGHVFSQPSSSGLCPKCNTSDFSLLLKVEENDPIWIKYKSDLEQLSINSISPIKALETAIETSEHQIKHGEYSKAKDELLKVETLDVDRAILEDKLSSVDGLLAQKRQEIIKNQIVNPEKDRPLGLCVILMDASGSMKYPAFHNSEATKINIIARAAASGIFDLKDMTNKKNAYIAMYTFDHRIKPVFLKSVNSIVDEFENALRFEEYLFQQLDASDMGGTSDINGAIDTSYEIVRQFLNQEIDAFKELYNGDEYPIDINVKLNLDTMETKNVPNVRVFIYTDGLQYVNGKSLPLVNPFKKGGGLAEVDLMLGAFIGPSSGSGSSGCKELIDILSNCPIHNEKQFFLIDNPNKLHTLKRLFKMSSSGSGFCHKCMEDIVSKAGFSNNIDRIS